MSDPVGPGTEQKVPTAATPAPTPPPGQASPRPEPRVGSHGPGGHAADRVRDTASGTTEGVRAEASRAAEALRAEGEGLLDAAKGEMRDLAEQGRKAGASQARGFAKALRDASDTLEADSPTMARAMGQAAESVEGLARSLREHGPEAMFGQVQALAHRQPAAFFGVAALAGFALARFARSSAPPRHGTAHRDGWRHQGWDDERAAGVAGGGAGHPDDLPPLGGRSAPSAHGGTEPRTTGAGAPGWVPGTSGARPATTSAATLGGAAARPAEASASGPSGIPPGSGGAAAAGPSPGGPAGTGTRPRSDT